MTDSITQQQHPLSPGFRSSMPISFSSPDQPRRRRPRRRRHRRARADQYRQDPSRHRAHARPFVRHHRAAAAAAGARGLQQGASSGSAPRRSRSSPARRRSSRRIRASGSRPSRRCRAISTSPSSPSTRCSSAPISNAATSSPTACSTAAGARRRWCSAPQTVRPMVERLLPGAHVLTPAAAVAAHLRGREEDHAAAAPLRHRRVLGRGGLRHRRADPPPARRRRGGAGRALAAHPQRAGRALSVRRRRISGRHRRHRHGAQSRRRSRRLRLRPQVRRLSVPQAQSGRAGADRRPRRPRHPRRHLRHHRTLPAVRDRTGAGARKPFVRADQDAAVAQHRARFLLDRRAAGLARRDAEGERPDARAGRRGHSGARACRARRRDPRARDDARGGRAAVGGLPGSRLPQDLARHPRRAGHHPLWFPDAGGYDPDRLVRPPGRAGGPHRRRHRHAVEPHRAYPDLDLRRQPSGLARRSRALAGRHARGRGQALRRAARAADRALRRPPHQRVDAAAAREHRCSRPKSARPAKSWSRAMSSAGSKDSCSRPMRRPPARKRRRSPAPRRRRWPARSTRARRGSRRRPTSNSCSRPTAPSAGSASRSASSSPARRC